MGVEVADLPGTQTVASVPRRERELHHAGGLEAAVEAPTVPHVDCALERSYLLKSIHGFALRSEGPWRQNGLMPMRGRAGEVGTYRRPGWARSSRGRLTASS
jgi:hypothetical protein